MDESCCRTLAVDDFEQWRHFVCSTLQKRSGVLIIDEVADGLEAVVKAQELQPDLIVLDIGLPTLNGIQAARRIRELSPKSKILFLSENRSWDIAEAALHTGADGYVVKSDAASDLLHAVEAILQGRRFVSASLAPGRDLAGCTKAANPSLPTQSAPRQGCHRVEFYPDDASLVEGFARFIETALQSGRAVTFIATESHRADLLQRLKARAVDVDELVEQGKYTSLDVIEVLATVLGSNGLPDPVQCAEILGELYAGSAQTPRTAHHPVAACGELAPVLLKQGKVEAAIQIEHITDEFARNHEIDIFCGYLSSVLPPRESGPIIERISLGHSTVHGE